ncbi:MAG TPA: hypothetical protein VET48_12580 [Steroidobacteraceae bacterium]|nr:hypothetical protein [Steroidobacteraceae bacterium]
MITVCHPLDDLEVLQLQTALEAAQIPYFVFSGHLGSLFPGLQIRLYNERSIQVPPSCVEEALQVIREVRASRTPSFVGLRMRSKLRIFFEAFFLGFPVLAGERRPVAGVEEPQE